MQNSGVASLATVAQKMACVIDGDRDRDGRIPPRGINQTRAGSDAGAPARASYGTEYAVPYRTRIVRTGLILLPYLLETSRYR